MSAWTLDAFDNPAGKDWIGETLQVQDTRQIEEALDLVLDMGDSYLEMVYAQTALAAIETVAAAIGRPSTTFLEQPELAAWLKRVRLDITPQIIYSARKTLARIVANDSEMREYWEDSREFDAWLATVYDLRERLLP